MPAIRSRDRSRTAEATATYIPLGSSPCTSRSVVGSHPAIGGRVSRSPSCEQYDVGLSHIAIAGAGFSGAVVARELAEAGHRCTVYETRSHVGGNCFTERHETGVMVHRYGPHIFHTANERVWEYINRFGDMRPYNHRVKTTVQDRVYSLPINLHTINQVFDKTFSPGEAEAFIRTEQATPFDGEPENFEEQALSMVGATLYELFFEGYTRKQWGCNPTQLPASILKRLPVRFNYDDSYFNHPYQALPAEGYTPIVEAVLDHPSIDVRLDTAFPVDERADFDHVIWTGPLDAWFNFEHGRLSYRTLDFEEQVHQGDFQGTPVMNYGDQDVPYTRITEHKHFAPWEDHDATVCFVETSREHEPNDIPYYPVRLVDDKLLLDRYLDQAQADSGVSFLGRLGTYRYLDMDVTIAEALTAADAIRSHLDDGSPIPVFFIDPR